MAGSFLRARWQWHTLRGPRLRRYQRRRGAIIAQYATTHAPFYREHWAGHDPRRWWRLPPMDKGLMMAHFSRFNTRGIGRDPAMVVALRAERERDFAPTLAGLTVGLSSGTSGHRGLFLVSAGEGAAWAGTILARLLHQVPRGSLRVAFFLRSNSNLYEGVGGLLVQFRFFDLMLPLDEAIAGLNELQPEIVIGPASLLGLLAQAQAAGTLRIRPQRLIAVAEVLEPPDQARLETVFAAPVQQIYQCTEGLLAVSCAHGSLHVQEDIVALQLHPLPGGDGRVTPLVTDLWRRTQPIIRYQLNDVLHMATAPCACGSPWRVIAAIEGRCDDLCYFVQSDGRARPFFADTIRRMILLAHPAILDYQAVQARPGQLALYLDVPPAARFDPIAAAVRASVETTVAHYGCRPALLTVTTGVPPRLPGAKRRRVIRET